MVFQSTEPFLWGAFEDVEAVLIWGLFFVIIGLFCVYDVIIILLHDDGLGTFDFILQKNQCCEQTLFCNCYSSAIHMSFKTSFTSVITLITFIF